MSSTLQTHDGRDRDISLPANRSIKWWIALSFAFAATAAALLLGEREPTGKELGLAYRAHSGAAQGELRLEKQTCEKLAAGQYRCRAGLTLDGQPIPGAPATVEAIYTRDDKAWRFAPLDPAPR